MKTQRSKVPTTISLLVCLFIGALWVRSYWFCDTLQINKPSWHELATYRGRLLFAHGWNSMYTFPFYLSERVEGVPWAFDLPDHEWYVCRWQGHYSIGYFFIGVPLAIPLAGMGLLTWVLWRRTRRIDARSAFPVEVNPAPKVP